MGPLTWIWEQLRWLVGLADKENLRHLVNLGGPAWVSYAVLCGIVFSETGLLVGFFLPGDSLLFTAGFLASQGLFDIFLLNGALMIAAISGDAVNYHLGRQAGAHVFDRGRLRFIRHEHLMAAKAFYERHGGKAIVLARFVPIVRTFTPFVAGVARMPYRQFVTFNIAGGIGWVASMTLAGYWLGRIPFIERHFEATILAIVLISVLPVVIEAVRGHRRRKAALNRPSDQVAAETASASSSAGGKNDG